MDTAHPNGTERNGRELLAQIAPTIAPVLDRMEAAMWREVEPGLARLTIEICRDGADWRAMPDLDDRSRTACEFAEQFALDVGSLDAGLRDRTLAAFGNDAFGFVQATYIADMIGRARRVLDRIAGAAPPASGDPSDGATPGDASMWSAIEDLIRLVPALDGIDVVTTEYVRLRGATAHKCRKCQSLRSRPALAAGAELADLDVIDDYVGRGLPDALQAALAFTDAFIWTPTRIDDDVLDALGRHYTPAQQVELVLDIARNATNKIAVALGADGTDVTEGYEVYEVFADGSIEYGLAHP